MDETVAPLYEQRQWLQVMLSSIGDAVFTTDGEGKVTFLNHVAQALTGWNQSEAAGVALEVVFRIINEETRHTVENPATRALREMEFLVATTLSILLSNRDCNGMENLRRRFSAVVFLSLVENLFPAQTTQMSSSAGC